MAKPPKKPDAVAAAEITAKGAESAAGISRSGVIKAATITATIGALALLFINLSKPSVPPPTPTQSVQAGSGATVTQKNESNHIQVSGSVGTINQGTITQNFNNPLPTPRTRATTEPTATRIIKEVKAAEPLRQEAVGKTYAGAKVAWIGELMGARNSSNNSPENPPEYLMLMRDGTSSDKFSMASFSFAVPKSGHEFLLLAKEGDKFFVTGTIVDIFNGIVFLKFDSISVFEP